MHQFNVRASNRAGRTEVFPVVAADLQEAAARVRAKGWTVEAMSEGLPVVAEAAPSPASHTPPTSPGTEEEVLRMAVKMLHDPRFAKPLRKLISRGVFFGIGYWAALSVGAWLTLFLITFVVGAIGAIAVAPGCPAGRAPSQPPVRMPR